MHKWKTETEKSTEIWGSVSITKAYSCEEKTISKELKSKKCQGILRNYITGL
jgi:hypothetical protein